jgi:non-specific serine/threonine protein kinase
MAPPSRASGAGAGPAPVRLRSFPWRWVASGALAAGLVTAALFGTSRTSFVPAGSRDLTATALPEAAGGVTPEAAAGGSASVPVDGRSGAAPTVRVAPPASGFAATTLERDAAAVAALAGASPVVAGMRVTPDLPQGASSTALAAAVGPRTDGATAAGANGGAGGAVVPGAAGGVSDARPAHGALALAMPGNTPSAGGAVRARPARPPARSANGDTGQLRLGISPWGEVYVDGALRGVTPPLDRLALAPGTYAVEIRNAGAVSLRRTLVIHPGESVSISHQF